MRITQVTPFVLCSDLEASIAFFIDRLGFACPFQAEGYAFVRRDVGALRLLQADGGIDLTDERREQMCYFDVEDVDALWAELDPGLRDLPEGRVRAPFDQPYGQREFHVTDPDALLMLFGQAIPGP